MHEVWREVIAEDVSYASEAVSEALKVGTICARRLREKSRRQRAWGTPRAMKQQQKEEPEKASKECFPCSVIF